MQQQLVEQLACSAAALLNGILKRLASEVVSLDQHHREITSQAHADVLQFCSLAAMQLQEEWLSRLSMPCCESIGGEAALLPCYLCAGR